VSTYHRSRKRRVNASSLGVPFAAFVGAQSCLIALAAFPGCAIAGCSDTVNLDDMPTNRTIHTKRDCRLTIKLDSLPGNGLRWQLKSYDPLRVALLSARYGNFESAVKIGAPQTQEIIIRTLKRGPADVVLEYVRFGRNVLTVRHLHLLIN
jgi:predicted secreted protein